MLDHNQLQGTILPTLSACRSLYYLALSYNQLHGSVPPEFSLLTSLKYLHLGVNSVTSTIPPSFGNLSAFVQLDLSENELSGTIPNSLANFSKLKVLDLSENQISGNIPWEIGTKLSNLVILSLWGNQLRGNIPNSLGNCSLLQELFLPINRLSGTVPMELAKLNLLTKLYLHTNQLVSDSSNTLAFLTALTNCSHLQEIDMANNTLIGVLPLSIGQLSSNLYELNLPDNMISGSIPQQIVNLTNLTYLNLGTNLFSGNIPSRINRFHVLEELYLYRNNLEGAIPKYGFSGNVSIQGDVYSYGILIFEMVIRMSPSDDMFVGDMTLQKWVRSAFPNRLAEIVDGRLWRGMNENIEDNKCLISFIHIGLHCSSESPRERHSIRDVGNALESLKVSLMGSATASNLIATISELFENNNPTGTMASDSQSSSF
ncbi:probable LRR receptor-like serine/threonine-protein kinase At3g47570 [Cryptomeria japonica]|uniref:probable LRR receptor-like serine/threonine-protein kinase At3g47570 n=1 Tax=Cryptomeria japonica TaxID=3369 RepID=UPI0027DA9CC5|nr:probable LRR receptor-like serine/threonine-protein kinase At3g47570 [Cryptomeria japonica]